MNNSQKYFIAVLCCALKKNVDGVFDRLGLKSEDLCEDVKKEATRLSEIHSLAGLFNEGLILLSEDPTEKMRRTMASAALVAKAGKRYAEMRSAVEYLCNKEIPVTVMKGFVMREYYPVPEYRSFGDIDLLIGKAEGDKARKSLEELGYKQVNNELHVIGMKKDQYYFEIHTDLLADDFFVPQGAESLLRAPLEYTRPREGLEGATEFTPEFHFLYLILHIAKHFYCMGAGVRMFLDLCLMMENAKVNWKIAGEYLKTAGMARFAKTVLGVCEKLFGTEAPKELTFAICEEGGQVSSEVIEETTEYVLKGGVFGFQGPAYEVAKLRQAYMENPEAVNEENQSGVLKKTASKAVLPDRKTMESRYPFCRKTPWLLPVAHLVRIYKVFTDRRRARSAVVRMKRLCASEEAARKQVDFYRNIGL